MTKLVGNRRLSWLRPKRAPAARRTRRTLATLSRCTFTARAVLRTDLPSHSSPVTRTTMSFGQDGGAAQRTRSCASQKSISRLPGAVPLAFGDMNT